MLSSVQCLVQHRFLSTSSQRSYNRVFSALYLMRNIKRKKSFQNYNPPFLKPKFDLDRLQKLQNLRIIQKSLVYVIGLSPQIAYPEVDSRVQPL